MSVDVTFPQKLDFLFRPARYKVAYGGRGGAKSWGFARALLILAYGGPLRILCARELQNSIQDSVHKLLSEQIGALGLDGCFEIEQQIIRGKNGSEFIFAGVKNNPTKIKSMEGIDICWVEEAERVSNESWQVLIPTIRKEGSEIWVSFNPNEDTDPTYQRFVINSPDGAVVVPISWQDNPWFPEVLRQEKDYLARVDMDAYQHVWMGECRKNSIAQILAGKCSISSFEPAHDWHGPYQGADWGFSNDPTTLIRCWIHEKNLYIEHEVYGIGIEIDQIPAKFDVIPDARKYVTRGDNARPETISYLRRNGFPNLSAAEKWKGSIEDGIAFMRSFESIVIHPRCIHTAEEARLYSYKLDKLTGDPLPEVVDAHNHCMDAVRYALDPMIRGKLSKLSISSVVLNRAARAM
jgi:phage terminase large subunit